MVHYNNQKISNEVLFEDLERGDTFLFDGFPYICAVDSDDDSKYGIGLCDGWLQEFKDTTAVQKVEFELRRMS